MTTVFVKYSVGLELLYTNEGKGPRMIEWRLTKQIYILNVPNESRAKTSICSTTWRRLRTCQASVFRSLLYA